MSLSSIKFLQQIISILGILLAIFWVAVLKRGKDYIYRWNRVITRIENEHKTAIPLLLKDFEETAKKDDPPPIFHFGCFKGETTDMMRWVIYTILLVWVVVSIASWWETFIWLFGWLSKAIDL